ncbi:MAG: tetratricopeptide repeat protein [Bacteroidales bacterium]|nr:tetratricopeptide repeat protein [Bacteroidales bacterium]
MRKKSFTLLFQFCFLIAMGTIMVACNNNSVDNMPREEALKELDAKIDKDKNNADLHYQRGMLLITLGKEKSLSQYFKDAIVDLKKAIEIDNTKSEYYTALGDAHFSLGNVGDSYTALQEALRIDPENFEACLKMGEIAFYSKDYDRAMENLSKVTAQDKNNQTALFMKGFIYKETGDTTNAVGYFRRIIELYPDYEPAYEELGMLYAQHRNKLGLEYLTTALSLKPDNINVLYGLAILYQDAEDAEKANEYYVKILEIDPQNKYAWFNRGWMEMVLYEDYNAAVDFFSKAIDSDPNYAEAYHNRGLAYELMGDKTNASANYDQANKLGYKEN